MNLVDEVLRAFERSLDRTKLEEALRAALPTDSTSGLSAGNPTPTEARVLGRIVLADILDDAILKARPGDAAYPVRLFLGELGQRVDEEAAFTLAAGLNLYFRVEGDDEVRMPLGLLLSRLYYRLPLTDGRLRPKLSPILAELMSSQLSLVRFEAVDGQQIFDSSRHERAAGSDPTRSKIREPRSFLCRVDSNQAVRAKAMVIT